MLLKLHLLLAVIAFMPSWAQAQSELPSDQRYWDYYNWFRTSSVLNVVISGDDNSHVLDVINELQKLKKNGVILGQVVVIRGSSSPKQEAAFELLRRKFDALGLHQQEMESAADLTSKYKITQSPSWIVSYRGKEFVYEGLRNPQQLFTSSGVFKHE